MLSVGPPLLQASTGSFMYIPSTGTIPKCSFSGVYSNAKAFYRSVLRSSPDILNLKSTLSATFSSLASYSNSLWCSIFSLTRSSYPPAIISLKLFELLFEDSSKNIENAFIANPIFFLRS